MNTHKGYSGRCAGGCDQRTGRDIKTTKLGEVEIIAEATDDYGVAELKLIYRVGSNELQELVMESSDPLVESGAVDVVQRALRKVVIRSILRNLTLSRVILSPTTHTPLIITRLPVLVKPVAIFLY